MRLNGRIGQVLWLIVSCVEVGACRDLGDPSLSFESAGRNSAAGMSDARGGGVGHGGALAAGGFANPKGGTAGSDDLKASGGAAGHDDAIVNGGGAGADGPHGNSGAPSIAGTAGEQAGAADFGGPEEVVKPACLTFQGKVLSLTGPKSIAANMVPNNVPYAVYAAEPEGNVVIFRWKNGLADDASWQPWGCFDTVPHAAQLAAIDIYDNGEYTTPEVYATSETGSLFVRRFFAEGWAPWEQMTLPRPDSRVIDVAATSSRSTLAYVFILDDGRLFARHHVKIDAYSEYSPWTEIKGVPDAAVHACAGVTISGRRQVFVSTADGAVFGSQQDDSDAFGPFGVIGSGSSPAMSDIACGTLGDGTVGVFGVSDGYVWANRLDPSTSSEWQPESNSNAAPLLTFTIGSRENGVPTVLGTDRSNVLWWHVVGTDSWAYVD